MKYIVDHFEGIGREGWGRIVVARLRTALRHVRQPYTFVQTNAQRGIDVLLGKLEDEDREPHDGQSQTHINNHFHICIIPVDVILIIINRHVSWYSSSVQINLHMCRHIFISRH